MARIITQRTVGGARVQTARTSPHCSPHCRAPAGARLGLRAQASPAAATDTYVGNFRSALAAENRRTTHS